MKELIAYITAFNPNFVNQVKGASQSKIRALETISGKRISSEYRDYLTYVGEKSGELFLYEPTENTNIDKIIESYQDMSDEGWMFPNDCILICEDIYPNEQLVLRRSDLGEETVWRLDEGEWYVDIYAESFKGLLWRRAFTQYALKDLANRKYWQIDPYNHQNNIDFFKKKLQELRIEPLWFSDSLFYCAQSQESRVVINTYSGGCHIYVSSSSNSVFFELNTYLETKLKALEQEGF